MNDIEKTKDAIIEMTMSEYIGECLCADSQEIILQALEKQIPKEPIFEGDNIASHYHCPTCGRLYWEKEDINKCCDLCGQRLEAADDR